MIPVRSTHIKEDRIAAFQKEIEYLESEKEKTTSIVKKMFYENRIKSIQKKIKSLES